MVNLYFYDGERAENYPPTEEQLNTFPSRYVERYRNAKTEPVRQQAVGSATLLATHLGVSSNADLIIGEHGRLSLRGTQGSTLVLQEQTPCYFSLSHSDSVTVLAVSDRPIGVDLECIRCDLEQDREVPEAIVKRFFPPSFQSELADASEGEREETFYRLWTRLEAAVKLDGRGLTAPRGEFEDLVNRYDITTERDGDLIWSIATKK